MTTVDARPGAGRREWIGLAVLCVPTFLVAMDFSVLYLAVPHLTAALAPSATQQTWIVDIYGFVIAGFLVTMGHLGDRIGRKRLLLIGATVFGIASVAAAFSANPGMLIASRGLLGVAGAAVTPSVMALVTGMFTEQKQRGRALAIWTACFMGGSTLGPLVGGVLLGFFWWGSVFLVSVPGVVILLVFGPSLLPAQQPSQSGRPDLVSFVLSLLAILPFVYGLQQLARFGWQWFPGAALVFGIVVGIVFIQRQRHAEHPLLDLKLFSNRTYSATVFLFFVSALVGAGALLIITQFLQDVTGLTPLAAALLLLVPNVLMVVASLVTPQLASRIRPSYLIAGGLFVACLGYLLFLLAGSTSSAATIFFAMCVVMLGTAPTAALANHLAMGSVPPEKAGSGAAIVQTATEFALGLGIATLATVGTAVYRTNVQGALHAVPPGAAAAARENIDRAVVAAHQLPGAEGRTLLLAAREAFTSGLHVVGIISAILFAGLCILVLRVFRDARNAHGSAEDTTPSQTDLATEPAADEAA